MMRPRKDHVVLELVDEDERTTAAGIVIPGQPSLAKQRARVAKVVDVNPGECGVERGDFVLWDAALESFRFDDPETGKPRRLVSGDRLLGIVDDPASVVFDG